MKLGTVVYENKIYNLDYMSIEEMKTLLEKIESEQKLAFKEAANDIPLDVIEYIANNFDSDIRKL